MADETSRHLLERWREGDQQAATELFERYANRLIGLAQRHLNERLGRRLDAEDVVQSVFNSFFVRTRDGAFILEESGELWRLLVTMTLNKLDDQIRHHTADKRNVTQENHFSSEDSLHGLSAGLLAREPSPEQAAALAEMVQQILTPSTRLPARSSSFGCRAMRCRKSPRRQDTASAHSPPPQSLQGADGVGPAATIGRVAMIGTRDGFDRHEHHERCLRRFEEEWQTGTPPALDAFLPNLSEGWQDDPAQRDLVVELIAIDLEYRLRQSPEARGREPNRHEACLEDYCRRYSLGAVEALPLELLGAEYEARCLAGHATDLDAFLARFPGRADLLRPLLANRRGAVVPVAAVGEDTRGGDTLADASSAALASVLQSLDILDPEYREPLAHIIRSGACPTAPEVLTLAVERSWLTAFQAEQIIAGRGEQLLQGPYVLLRPLGEGGMSKVYLARHRLLQRNVAFKVIRRSFIADAGEVAVQRFYQEMQAVGRLSHPNLIHAYDAGPVGGTHFLAMEYVDGVDLGRLVRVHGPLPCADACRYIHQAALGLQHVFECGLVHRDLKPSNLLLAADKAGEAPGVVKILDLGLASLRWAEGGRSRAGLTGVNAFLGTPDYIAPEQVLDPATADIRADLYSLGCTLYHLLVGTPPFPGGTMTQKLHRHLEEPPPSVTALRPDVPPPIAGIVDRLLAKRPEERFQTPHDLAEALDTAGLPFASLAEPAGSATGRRTRIAAAVAALMVAGIVTVAVLAWPARTEKPPPRPPDAVEVAWEALRARVPASDAEREPLRRAFREFHDKHPGTRQGEEAALAARKLPSALDRLYRVTSDETRGLVAVFHAHEGPVYGVGVSPDGTMLATSGANDPVIKLWELRGRSFVLREKLTGHEEACIRSASRRMEDADFDQLRPNRAPLGPEHDAGALAARLSRRARLCRDGHLLARRAIPLRRRHRRHHTPLPHVPDRHRHGRSIVGDGAGH